MRRRETYDQRMNTSRSRALVAALLIVAAAVTLGVIASSPMVSANQPAAEAECNGLAFEIPDGVAGTTVTVWTSVNGGDPRPAAAGAIGSWHDSLDMWVPSPDPYGQVAWRIVIVTPDADDEVIVKTVERCAITTTTSTTVGATSTTTSTTVASGPATTAATTTVPATSPVLTTTSTIPVTLPPTV